MGEDFKTKTTVLACGLWFPELKNDSCVAKLDAAYAEHTKDLNEKELEVFNDSYYIAIGMRPYRDCEVDAGLVGADASEAKGNEIITCTASKYLLTGSKPYKYEGKSLSLDPMLKYLHDRAKGMVGIGAGSAEMPTNLKLFIEGLRKLGDEAYKVLADKAEELYKDALGKVGPKERASMIGKIAKAIVELLKDYKTGIELALASGDPDLLPPVIDQIRALTVADLGLDFPAIAMGLKANAEVDGGGGEWGFRSHGFVSSSFGLKFDHTATSWFKYEAALAVAMDYPSAMIRRSDEDSSLVTNEGSAGSFSAKLKRAYLGGTFKAPIGDGHAFSAGLAGGVIKTATSGVDYGVSDTRGYWGGTALIGRGPGLKVDPSFSFLSETLKVGGSFVFAAGSGYVSFTNTTPEDADGDGLADEQNYADAKGMALQGSFFLDYLAHSDWFKFGVAYHGASGLGSYNAKDPGVHSGMTSHTVDAGFNIPYLSLDANFRYNRLEDSESVNFNQFIGALRYKLKPQELASGFAMGFSALLSYMHKEGKLTTGSNVPGGTLDDWANGDTSMARKAQLAPGNRAFEISVGIPMVIKNESDWFGKAEVTPWGTLMVTPQLDEDFGTDDIGWAAGAKLAIEHDWL